MKIILIIIVVAAVLFGLFTLIRNIKAKNHAPLISYRTSYGGGMDGSSRFTKIKKLDDETVFITISHSDWIFQDPQVTEYTAPISYLRDIEKLFDDSKMYKYDTLPETPFHALDAGSDYYSFVFEDYDSVSFDSEKVIPKRGKDALWQIDTVIDDAIKNGQLLPGLVHEQMEDEEMLDSTTGNDGEITIRVFEYSETHLQYRLHNGTEEDIELPGNVEIYKLDGDSRTLIAEDSDYSGSFLVYKTHFRDETIELGDRLEPGNYLICLADIQSEFEIGDVTKTKEK